MPYGRMKDGSVSIGSLELLSAEAVMPTINTSDPAMRTGSAGEETAAQVIADFPHESFDLVIMNPPFTSNTKHYDSDDGVLNAAFAAFDASDDDQAEMARRLRRLATGTSYHGHAGLGSAFAALATRKLRPNGVVALVLPFTALNGASWAKFRKLMATRYTDISVVTIAANGNDMSFSSDTGIAECLVVGRKVASSEKRSGRGRFVSLRRRPASFVESQEISKEMRPSIARRLEDGPFGGIPVYCGDATAGEMLDVPVKTEKTGWGAARILDASVAQAAHALSGGKLWLPGNSKPERLRVARLGDAGRLGAHDSMFILKTHNGPFVRVESSPTATYPSLWNHDAAAEKSLVCTPDSALRVKPGMEQRAAKLWSTASRAHISRGFRFNSQPLAVALTEQNSAGGRAWPNVTFEVAEYDLAFATFGNSTLGLLCYWWHSNCQVSGRGDMTRLAIPSLPMLDFRALTKDQLATAEAIFEEMRGKELKPAYLADADPNRALLDRRVVCDLLGFDEEVYAAVRRLAAKWCAEPSVHGGKARPKDAKLVI